MLDFDLQLRFWRGVTDAYLHGVEATMAATSAWQDQVLAPKPQPKKQITFPMFDMTSWSWTWPTGGNTGLFQNPFLAPFMTGFQSPFQAPALFPVQSQFQSPFLAANPYAAMMPWVEIFWRQSMDFMPSGKSALGGFPQANPAAMFGPFWNWAATPWTFMQTPLTAMMMSAGLPYNVASPSAKAGTAAMDAADAAHKQMEHVFSAYRSDSGYAAAQIMSLPWSVAASFMANEPKPGRAA